MSLNQSALDAKPDLMGDQVLANGGRIFTQVIERDALGAPARYRTRVIFRNHVLVEDEAAETEFEAGRQHQKHLMSFMRHTKDAVEDQRKGTREQPRCESCHGESLEEPLVSGECRTCRAKREERRRANSAALASAGGTDRAGSS